MGADQYQYDKILKIIETRLIPDLKKISDYNCVPEFIKNLEPVANIEDLNVMAPDSIGQNVPIKYLSTKKPTRGAISSTSWNRGQTRLMEDMDKEYDKLGKHIIDNFT
ncbi:hypothetical protein [Dapis sp. BLCC M229]|uniref:hypothetical protein n=1 Tax=Dapis sp. BLCC M229 TaxID=3400188 RepID=UPI003CF819A3